MKRMTRKSLPKWLNSRPLWSKAGFSLPLSAAPMYRKKKTTFHFTLTRHTTNKLNMPSMLMIVMIWVWLTFPIRQVSGPCWWTVRFTSSIPVAPSSLVWCNNSKSKMSRKNGSPKVERCTKELKHPNSGRNWIAFRWNLIPHCLISPIWSSCALIK